MADWFPMSLSVTLLTILSGVALLLWGLRMVKRAVLRGYGDVVQKAIAKGTKNRIYAALTGFGVTLFLQSSTATALLASSFVGRGLMTVTAGLAIMIGADIGTAVVAQILSFKISWLAPLLLSVGIIFHLSIEKDSDNKRHIARIIIGLGFMLTALSIIRQAAAPIASSETLPIILAPLVSEPALAVIVSALLAFLMHSSVSAILLFATLTAGGVLPLSLALTFVIGANIGVGVIPLLAVMKDTPQAAQVPLGNLIMRVTMGLACLFGLGFVLEIEALADLPLAQAVIASHLGFNIVLMIVFLPLIGGLAKLCERLKPALSDNDDHRVRPRYLDEKALSSPSVAISCAMRETLNMAELLEGMLNKAFVAIEKNDPVLIDNVRAMDDPIDRIFLAIKNYVIRLSREELKDDETEQSILIMNFATNLEHCGDIIETSMMDLAAKKAHAKDNFSDEGLKEIKDFHNKVVKNLQLAQSIFLSRDKNMANQLLDYKRGLKKAEDATAKSHMQRIKSGVSASIATSDIHMDIIRDLRRINSYVSSLAYTVIEK